MKAHPAPRHTHQQAIMDPAKLQHR